MGNLGQFNSKEIPAQNMDFDPLPLGMYLAQIVESDVVETRKGDGEIAKFTFEILEKGYEGRRVWLNLNIANPNEKAQQIGLGMLSSLCRAIGKIGVVSDTSLLHEKKLIIKLTIEPGTAEYPNPKNKITGFYPAEEFSNSKPSEPVKAGTRVKGRKNLKDKKEEIEEEESEKSVEEELPDFLK